MQPVFQATFFRNYVNDVTFYVFYKTKSFRLKFFVYDSVVFQKTSQGEKHLKPLQIKKNVYVFGHKKSTPQAWFPFGAITDRCRSILHPGRSDHPHHSEFASSPVSTPFLFVSGRSISHPCCPLQGFFYTFYMVLIFLRRKEGSFRHFFSRHGNTPMI